MKGFKRLDNFFRFGSIGDIFIITISTYQNAIDTI